MVAGGARVTGGNPPAKRAIEIAELRAGMTANEFRAAIAALGWSQVHAADELGIAPRTARSYALGERPVPTPIVKLLEAALTRETERQ